MASSGTIRNQGEGPKSPYGLEGWGSTPSERAEQPWSAALVSSPARTALSRSALLRVLSIPAKGIREVPRKRLFFAPTRAKQELLLTLAALLWGDCRRWTAEPVASGTQI